MTGSEACGAPHPERPDIECDREAHQMAGFHRNRAAGEVWEGEAPPEPALTGRNALASMAARTTRSARTGAPADAVAHWASATEEEKD
ncbi:hypothetical protein [Streptomyces sp. NPDC088752]|uniref:hypothetical protein n=1 Tax=Streptomyces sp. NPDC088752 TaxID=3154963 RepID=UPI0034238D53